MKMYCYKIEDKQVSAFSYDNFIKLYKDINVGKLKWNKIKEKLESKPKKYKTAKYINHNHNNIIYVFGFGLTRELLEEMVEIDSNSKDIKFYILHKNKKVAEIVIHNNEKAEENGKVLDYNELPPVFKLGTDKSKVVIDKILINYWLKNRSMRLDRIHYDRLIKMLKVGENRFDEVNEISLVIRTYALSLNDCYWIKQKDNDIEWGDINFFENDFDIAINKLYLDTLNEHQIYKFVGTPNNTTAGQLRKVWEINDKKERILYKKTDGVLTDVINEKIVSDYLSICGIEHVNYWLEDKYNGLCCVCKNECDINNEFICFNDIVSLKYNEKQSKKENLDKYMQIIFKDKKIGLEAKKQFENMILIDILFSNTDRHWGNFGIIRDSKTLEIRKMMPIFDNGFSMCGAELDRYMDEFNTEELMRIGKIDDRKLFKTFDYLEDKLFDKSIIDNLDKVIPIMEREYKKYNINEKRIKVIKEFLQENINKIKEWYNKC